MSLTGPSYSAGPFVTSVGGTTRKESDPQSEIASLFSGGGFSTFFEIKPYQIDKVKPYLDYLTKNKMDPKLYQCVRSDGLT